MEDLLTIAIPVFNRSTYFREALDSAVQQTVQVRVMVVDNASTEFDFKHAVTVLGLPRVSYHCNLQNIGMIGNWNRCIELCATPYLLILHDDDRIALNYTEELAKVLPHRPNIVVCRNEIIDENGIAVRSFTEADYSVYHRLEGWCLGNPAPVGAVFRVEAARLLGGFRASFKYTPDYHLWFQLALLGQFCLINKLMGFYREHQDPGRESVILRREFETMGRFFVQLRRNCSSFAAHYPDRDVPVPKREYVVGFGELIAALPRVSSWRRNYLLGLYVNSSAMSRTGSLSRRLFRLLGRPLCSLLLLLREGLAKLRS